MKIPLYCIMADPANSGATYVIRPCNYLGDGNWHIGEAEMFTPDIEEAKEYLKDLVNQQKEGNMCQDFNDKVEHLAEFIHGDDEFEYDCPHMKISVLGCVMSNIILDLDEEERAQIQLFAINRLSNKLDF